jgi:thiol-disulfide isomerase/thioredoxin
MKNWRYLVLLVALVLTIQIPTWAQSAPDSPPAAKAQENRRKIGAEVARIQKLPDTKERISSLRKLLQEVVSMDAATRDERAIVIIKLDLAGDLIDDGAPEKEFGALLNDAINSTEKFAGKIFILGEIVDKLVEKNQSLGIARAVSEHMVTLAKDSKMDEEEVSYFEGNLGVVLFKQGEIAKAQGLLEKSVKLSNNADHYFTLAALYEQQGKKAETGEALLQAAATAKSKTKKEKYLEKFQQHYTKEKGSEAGAKELVVARRHQLLEKKALVELKHEGEAPSWQLTNLEGKKLDSADFQGKVVVLDWWGSWCPPCRAELPHFQELYEKYRSKGVVFIAMNWEQPNGTEEERLAKAKKFIQDNNYTFPVAFDPEMEVGNKYQVNAFPTVYIIDGKGKLRYRNIGFDSDVADIMEIQINAALDNK